MNEILIGLLCIIFSFGSSYWLMKAWIRVCKLNDYMVKDMNKYLKNLVPLSGGVPFIMSFIPAVSLYMFFKIFYLHTETNLVFILALLLTSMLACFVGFLDDFVLKKTIKSIGLKGWQKPLLTLIFALPLAAVNSGNSIMIVPVLGAVNFGIIYPIIFIPLAVMLASNAFNLLAGYNGLEGGMGIVVLSTMGIISWMNGYLWLSMISFIAVASLLAYIIFNWCPAKIFPGDSLTYTIGALIAAIAIFGDMETIALILFIPYYLDALFLIRARTIHIDAFGIPNRDNSLKLPYKKIYDTTQVSIFLLSKIKKKVYEQDVVLSILAFEALLGVLCTLFLA